MTEGGEGVATRCSTGLMRLLQESLHNKDWVGGRHLHALATAASLHTLPCIAHLLIRLLSLSSNTLLAASSIFCTLPSPSLASWHSIIAAHSNLGHPLLALHLYHSMLLTGLHPSKPIFLIALKSCATSHALYHGCHIHHHIVQQGLDFDVFVSSALVYMYAKCSSLTEARSLFDSMLGKTRISWNAMLAGYVHAGQSHSAIELFENMERESIEPDQVTFSCVFKACGLLGALEQGKHVHQHAVESGLSSNQYVVSAMVDMYAKCGGLHEAQEIFANLQERNAVLWNTIISGYVRHGHNKYAIEIFIRMQEEGVHPDNSTVSTILKACGNLGAKEKGSVLHALILENSITADEIVLGALVDMYVKCGDLEDAHSIFNTTTCRNTVTWGAILAGCAQQEQGLLTLEIFEEMQSEGIQSDSAIYSCVLKAVGLIGALEEGKLVHDQIVRHGLETDVVVGSALVDMYNKCGTLDDGSKAFEFLPKQDLISWSTMIAGHVQHGSCHRALQFFQQLQREDVLPDIVMFSCMLNACGGIKAVNEGKYLHDQIVRSEFDADGSLGIGLIDMYAKCGHLEEAVNLLDRLSVKNLLAWGAIIVGHVQHGDAPSAFKYFAKMQEEGVEADETILMCLLKTCSSLQELKSMHEKIRQCGFLSHLGIGNSLIDMYGKTGNLVEARAVFNGLSQKDVVSWNSMIAGYAEHGLAAPAFELFEKMQQEGYEFDTFTFSCILKACRKVRVSDLGNLIYKQIIRKGFETDVVIARAAIEMYAEFGSLEDARKVFDSLPSKDPSSWSVMVGAYAAYNHIELAMQCFEEMQRHGLKPDDRMRTSILASFSHSGEWEQGRRHLKLMNEEPWIHPKIEHFNCAVDLLGRSGHVREAGELLRTMPLAPDVISWTALLAACRLHGNKEVGKDCVEGDRNGTRPVKTNSLYNCHFTDYDNIMSFSRGGTSTRG